MKILENFILHFLILKQESSLYQMKKKLSQATNRNR